MEGVGKVRGKDDRRGRKKRERGKEDQRRPDRRKKSNHKRKGGREGETHLGKFRKVQIQELGAKIVQVCPEKGTQGGGRKRAVNIRGRNRGREGRRRGGRKRGREGGLDTWKIAGGEVMLFEDVAKDGGEITKEALLGKKGEKQAEEKSTGGKEGVKSRKGGGMA